MNGIIYTRVSSEEQVKGTSLEFQEDLCRKYAEQRSIEVVQIFREEGESAKDLSLNNRKKFLEALEFCSKNKNNIKAFIVLRVDRFARNTEDHFAVRKILTGYGTTLFSVTEPIGNKPAEKFIETVLAGASEYDNAIRKQRCTDGMLSRINQGIYPYKPPIGYKCMHNKKHGEKKNIPDPPDSITFPLIQRALKTFATGMFQQKEVARLLTEWGLKTENGNLPTPQLVARILRKNLKFYAGILINPWTLKETKGLHEPMITLEELNDIQVVLNGKKSYLEMQRCKQNEYFPLRRSIKCGYCFNYLTASSPRGNGGRYFYYHCVHKDCPNYAKSISKNVLEQEYSSYLSNIILKKETISAFKTTIMNLWENRTVQNKSDKNRINASIQLLESKKRRIYEMREDGSYTKEEFLERKAEIESEIKSLKTASESFVSEDFDMKDILSYVCDFIDSMAQKWIEMPYELQCRFQKLIFPEGVIYTKKTGFGTTKVGHIFSLIQTFSGNKSAKVDLYIPDWNHFIDEVRTIRRTAISYKEASVQSPGNDPNNIQQQYRNVA